MKAHQPPPPNGSATASPWFHEADLRAPGPLLLLLEGRAPWEFAALLAARPWLRRLPQGDGHPVLVFPGFCASDVSTVPLRGFLRDVGFTPYEWKQGTNLGPRPGVLEACRSQLRAIADRHGQKVSLVGWSLGGVYAREMAKLEPDLARCVVTLGSPFAGHPRATNAWRLYDLFNQRSVHDEALIAQVRVAPPQPTTSIFSRSDGVVAWQCSLNEDAPHTENIEVSSSHVGLGLNPLALFAMADRLRQDPARWQRFDLAGARRLFYRSGTPRPAKAAPA